MDNKELSLLQHLPLDIKIAKTKLRIEEFVRYYGIDNVYISFSGGKDSSVLLHIARSIYPDIKAMFVDTGLEFPELKKYVKSFDNVDIIKPKKSFKQIIEKYGYPVISKEQSRYIYDVRYGSEKLKLKRLGIGTKRFKISDKHMYMLDAPFEISDKCCYHMKKAPSKKYEKETQRFPILGIMAHESYMRKAEYLKNGCNSFNGTRPKSTPIGFWTEQDILRYIDMFNINICSVYGNIAKHNDTYITTGEKRTGCVFCMYGNLNDVNVRFDRLKETHNELHTYCMDKLKIKDVLDYMNRR